MKTTIAPQSAPVPGSGCADQCFSAGHALREFFNAATEHDSARVCIERRRDLQGTMLWQLVGALSYLQENGNRCEKVVARQLLDELREIVKAAGAEYRKEEA